MAAISHVSGMIGCRLAPSSSMRCGLPGDRPSGGIRGKRELRFGIGRGRVKGMHAWACKANEDEDGGNEVVNPLDLEKEFRKALDSEESKALMKDLADATKRVSEKKRELDDISRQEKKVQELQSFLERLDADQQVADSEVPSNNRNHAVHGLGALY